ncbi:hypothetical protein BVX95_00280 [archaeon D22]|nr:hypothetical protein BVX95_00280 [archaeon D22]
MELQVDKLIKELNLTQEEYIKFRRLIEDSRKRELEMRKIREETKMLLDEYEEILDRFSKLLIAKSMHDYTEGQSKAQT